MSLDDTLHTLVGLVPVPGLSTAVSVLKFIISGVRAAQESKTQLAALAISLGHLLATLHREFVSARLTATSCEEPLQNLMSLLDEIHRFVEKHQERSLLKYLFDRESTISAIRVFYHRISVMSDAFQISASLSIRDMLQENERARREDAAALQVRFEFLENSHNELRRALDINHNNMLAMMVSLERRLEQCGNERDPEHKFYAHTLQYLTTTSGQKVEMEDWMISRFDVEYGPQIGIGGFGTVFRGTWNRTEVAIKLVRNPAGIAADVSLLQKEVHIWKTLRHPNILQFLGANTLDDAPFVVMPLVPCNSREFLRARSDFDPLYILCDISLGLEYLHARKISHGDLKGINVMVEPLGRALLCDFGLARIKADMTSRTRTKGDAFVPGSRNWMAPELLSGSLPRTPSDVYAFGMTLYELYTDEVPMALVPHGDFIELVFRLGVRPERPDENECPRMNDGIWGLAERCWAKDAKVRPTARQLHDSIKELMVGYTPEPPVKDARSSAPKLPFPEKNARDGAVELGETRESTTSLPEKHVRSEVAKRTVTDSSEMNGAAVKEFSALTLYRGEIKTQIERKLVIVGDGACGKSALLIVATGAAFPTAYQPAELCATFLANVEVGDKEIQLTLWDTPGQEDYDRLRPLSYPGAHVILICFGIDSPDSLDNVKLRWISEVGHFCPGVPFILVGCKRELRQNTRVIQELRKTYQRPVSTEEGMEVAKTIGALKYMECSGRTGHGVQELFREAALAALTASPAPKRRKDGCIVA
ncbi:Kinase-like protein [Mycena sanguinolenta]|uniref:Kinase-like protein n=1 Tax=Mycena sanguinolenta TaxID=230812 RepID=A0A8H6YD09_9AGAR|nr:Kinase-like protein [Mycena sanguinolenta]